MELVEYGNEDMVDEQTVAQASENENDDAEMDDYQTMHENDSVSNEQTADMDVKHGFTSYQPMDDYPIMEGMEVSESIILDPGHIAVESPRPEHNDNLSLLSPILPKKRAGGRPKKSMTNVVQAAAAKARRQSLIQVHTRLQEHYLLRDSLCDRAK
jgi:hypothetical protein